MLIAEACVVAIENVGEVGRCEEGGIATPALPRLEYSMCRHGKELRGGAWTGTSAREACISLQRPCAAQPRRCLKRRYHLSC